MATTETENEEKKSHSSFTKTVTMAQAVRDLVSDVKNSEKEREINRILGCMRINPVEILQISLDLDEKDIKKQYRKLSLLVHPDRCPEQLKERAQRAFTMLNNTKKDLESKDFMIKLKHQINEARRRVNERKMIEKGQQFIDEQEKSIAMEPPAKKQRTESTMDVSSAKPPQTDNDDKDDNDEQKQATNKQILIQLKEILIDCEWQKRITEQASQKIEQQTLQRREELKAKIAAQKQYKKEWEEGRDSRVSNWRDWQTMDKKKKKKKKKKKNKLKK